MNEYFTICHSSANVVTVSAHSYLIISELGDIFLLNLQGCGQSLACRTMSRESFPLMTVPITPDPQKSTLNPLDHAGGLAGHQGVLLNLHLMEKGHWDSSKSCGFEDRYFQTPLYLRSHLVFSSFPSVNEQPYTDGKITCSVESARC